MTDDFIPPTRLPNQGLAEYEEMCRIIEAARRPTPEQAARRRDEVHAREKAEQDALRNAQLVYLSSTAIDPEPLTTAAPDQVLVIPIAHYWGIFTRRTGQEWAGSDLAFMRPRQKALTDGWDKARRTGAEFIVINREIDPDEFAASFRGDIVCREGLTVARERWAILSPITEASYRRAASVMDGSLDEYVRRELDSMLSRHPRACADLWVRRDVTMFDLVAPEYLDHVAKLAFDRFVSEQQEAAHA